MTWAISVMIGVILVCVVVICYMVSNAMDYDPAWDEWEKIEEKKEKR